MESSCGRRSVRRCFLWLFSERITNIGKKSVVPCATLGSFCLHAFKEKYIFCQSLVDYYYCVFLKYWQEPLNWDLELYRSCIWSLICWALYLGFWFSVFGGDDASSSEKFRVILRRRSWDMLRIYIQVPPWDWFFVTQKYWIWSYISMKLSNQSLIDVKK